MGRRFNMKWPTKDGDVHLLYASDPNFHYEIYNAKMEAHSAPRMEARSGTSTSLKWRIYPVNQLVFNGRPSVSGSFS